MVSDLAWCAGFIDGEGCVNISQSKTGYYCIQLVVSCTVMEPLEKLESILGGSSVVMNKVQKGNRKASYQWKVTGRAAGEVLESILPWLTVKRAATLVALEAITHMGRGNVLPVNSEGLASCKRRLHVLNKRGV